MTQDAAPAASRRLSLEEIVSYCRRRGFIYQASEIYGGINGFWDFGPMGSELKRNIKTAWWEDMVTRHNPLSVAQGAPATFEMTGIDSSIIQHPQAWRVSGHSDLFSDMMVDCHETKKRYRFDHVSGRWIKDRDGNALFITADPQAAEAEVFIDQRARKILGISKSREVVWDSPLTELAEAGLDNFANVLAPHAAEKGTLTEPREFNLMFKTYIGAMQTAADAAFLRPETAQGIFLNFRNVVDSGRFALPLGIAQIGKSFRNEITPRHFIFRSREFEQMEMEFFCPPETAHEWYKYWQQRRLDWYLDLGLKRENIRVREHAATELSHYALGTTDIEYAYPFMAEGEFGELEGIANRGAFDLNSHSMGRLAKAEPPELALDENGAPLHRGSGKKMVYNDVGRNEKYVPYVIEPAAGADRALLAFLCDALEIEKLDDKGGEDSERAVLHIHPRLAPVKAAIFPLIKKEGQPEIAKELFGAMKRKWNVSYDEKGSIGRRYRRADEVGVPVCITIDDETVSNGTVTVRDRDTLAQERIKLDDCPAYLDKLIEV